MGVTGVGLLISIVVVCIITIIALLIFGLIPPVKATLTENIPGFEELLAEPGDTSVRISDSQFCLGNLGGLEHIISNPSDPHQASEVACSIANDIYDDFTSKGDAGSRLNLKKCNCWRGLCLLDVGLFSIDSTALYSTTLNSLMNSKNCEIPNPTQAGLDETYINFQLKDREFNGNDFCSNTIWVDGNPLNFGNSNCGSSDPINTWSSSSCTSFCSNSEDKLYWWAPESGSSEYLINDFWYGDRTSPNTNSLGRDSHTYIYGLFWGPDIYEPNTESEERYGVVFAEVPKQNTGTDIFDFVQDVFEYDSIGIPNYVRFNKIGYWYPEARRVADIIIDLPADVKEVELRSKIEELTGADVVFESCSYETNECLLKSPDSAEGCRGIFTDLILDDFKTQPFTFLADENIEENGWIYAGKYRVVIDNWFAYYRKPGAWWSTDNCFSYIDRKIIIYPALVKWTVGVIPEGAGEICINSDCYTSTTEVILDLNQILTLTANPSGSYSFDKFEGVGGGSTTDNPTDPFPALLSGTIYAYFS